jgi:hypothetical protein
MFKTLIFQIRNVSIALSCFFQITKKFARVFLVLLTTTVEIIIYDKISPHFSI